MTCGSKTIKKSAAAVALAILFVFSCIVILGKTVRADEISWITGDGWRISTDGNLEISSTAAFDNKEWENAGITIKSIFITAPTIPDYAFNQYTTNKYAEVATVTVNDTVTSVGVGCFKEFTGLTSVKYYPTYSKVPYMSFYNCSSLDNIAFSDSVTEIGDNAFYNCSALTIITMGNIQTIGSSAFSDCVKLQSVDLLNVTSIGYGAFCGCTKLESVKTTNAPSSGNPLGNVASIGALAFKNCSSLTSKLDLSNVTEIPYETFYGCTSLTEVDIRNAETIGKQAFYGCTKLSTAYMSYDTQSIEEEAFKNCTSLGNLGVIDYVTYIGESAFSGCSTISSVSVSAITSLGTGAFSNCTSLISVELGNDISVIPELAFNGCTKLVTINLGEIQNVGEKAFYGCESLEAADIRNVYRIESCAFAGCTNLERLAFGYMLNSIEDGAFEVNTITYIGFTGSQGILELWHFDQTFPNATIELLNPTKAFLVTMDYGYNYHPLEDTQILQIIVVKGKTTLKDKDPVRTGYTFTGWYTDKACSKLFDFDTPITEDITLYAGWAKEAIGVGDIIKGYSLSLEGDIGVKFYTVLPEGLSADAYMMFSVEGFSQPQKMYVKDAESITVSDVEYTVFKCCVPAKNMTSGIDVSLINGNDQLINCSYSVMRYANYILDNADDYKDAVPVVKALLNYGAYAQAYFECNTNYPANNIVGEDERDVSSVTADTLSAFATADDVFVNNDITFSSVNLELESKITMNMYFTGDLDGVTFKLNRDNELKVRKLADGRTVVSIMGISAEDIDEKFTVSLYSGETEIGAVTYSPMNYCYNVLARPVSATRTNALKDVVRALYLYNKAANAYK